MKCECGKRGWLDTDSLAQGVFSGIKKEKKKILPTERHQLAGTLNIRYQSSLCALHVSHAIVIIIIVCNIPLSLLLSFIHFLFFHLTPCVVPRELKHSALAPERPLGGRSGEPPSPRRSLAGRPMTRRRPPPPPPKGQRSRKLNSKTPTPTQQ